MCHGCILNSLCTGYIVSAAWGTMTAHHADHTCIAGQLQIDFD